jgi:hypothetical protein
MYYLLSICVILLLIVIFSNNINLNTCEEDIDIDKYKITTKKIINREDKYNIKKYDIINDNIIIHNKYKSELLNLKKYKNTLEQKEHDNKKQKLEQRNQEIKINSDKLKISDFQQQIGKLKSSIKSIKLTLKIDLNNFLNDYNQKKISSNDIKIIIVNLQKELDKNNKLLDINIDPIINIDDINVYHQLINIKNILLTKKINIFTKFLK